MSPSLIFRLIVEGCIFSCFAASETVKNMILTPVDNLWITCGIINHTVQYGKVPEMPRKGINQFGHGFKIFPLYFFATGQLFFFKRGQPNNPFLEFG